MPVPCPSQVLSAVASTATAAKAGATRAGKLHKLQQTPSAAPPTVAAAAAPAEAPAADKPVSELDYLKQRLAATEKLVADLAKQLQQLIGLAPKTPAAPAPAADTNTLPAPAKTPAPEAIQAPTNVPAEAPTPAGTAVPITTTTPPVAAAPLPEPKQSVGGEDDYAGILGLNYLFYEGQVRTFCVVCVCVLGETCV